MLVAIVLGSSSDNAGISETPSSSMMCRPAYMRTVRIMVSGRTVLLFSVFYYHLTSMVAGAWTRNEIDCYRDDLPKPLAADCLAAIDMIHAGTYVLDGSIQRPLKIYLPKSARRLFLMPAIFRSGTCLVHVEAIRTTDPAKSVSWHSQDPNAVTFLRTKIWSKIRRLGTCCARAVPYKEPNPRRPKPTEPPEGSQSASFLYTTVWPNVRRLATKVVKGCLPNELAKGGDVEAQSKMGNLTYSYKITVSGVPKGMPGDGKKTCFCWRTHQPGVIQYNVYEPGGSSSGLGTPVFPGAPRYAMYICTVCQHGEQSIRGQTKD